MKNKRRSKKLFGDLAKGALHRMLGIPENQIIPVSTLRKAAASGRELLRKRAQFALNARKFNH